MLQSQPFQSAPPPMDPTPPRITLLAARARGGAIGVGNRLPWHLPEDLQHFKATTLGAPILMGRRTFESIGRPLPGRRSIVVTRDPAWAHPGCERAGSLDEAIALCAGSPEVFVVGGGQLYAAAMPRADRLLLTEVDVEVAGDVFFPPVDPSQWRLVHAAPAVSRTGLAYSIGTWQRIAAIVDP
jgi:dihydrofolate reductase